MPKVVSIFSTQNGIGKSTVIANLSAWLSLLGKKVLILDLDYKKDVTLYTGTELPVNKINLIDILNNNNNFDNSIINTLIKDLYIAPIFYNEEDINFINSFFSNEIFSLRDSIDLIEKEFDYIFIDLPVNEYDFLISVLSASDSVILPLKCEEEDLEQIPSLIELIINVKEKVNKWLELDGILVNLYVESMFSRQILTKAKQKFGNLMYKSIIPRHIKVSEANNLKRPVALHDIKSFGAEAYLRLAKEFMKQNEVNI